MHRVVPAAALAAAVFLVPSVSNAGTTTSTREVLSAVHNCQPSLPAFDGAFRKRPLAMQNEGSAAAFVTCGFQDDSP